MHEAESSTTLLNYIYEYNYLKLSLSHCLSHHGIRGSPTGPHPALLACLPPSPFMPVTAVRLGEGDLDPSHSFSPPAPSTLCISLHGALITTCCPQGLLSVTWHQLQPSACLPGSQCYITSECLSTLHRRDSIQLWVLGLYLLKIL